MSAAASAAPTASGRSGDLELALAAAGSIVRVAYRNRGLAPLRLYGPVDGPDRVHHDHLRAELVAPDGGTRVLRFSGARDSSPIGLVELAPGAEVADDVDLAVWATRPGNGRPLVAGVHAVTMTYEAALPGGWIGRVTAGPVAIVAP